MKKQKRTFRTKVLCYLLLFSLIFQENTVMAWAGVSGTSEVIKETETVPFTEQETEGVQVASEPSDEETP